MHQATSPVERLAALHEEIAEKCLELKREVPEILIASKSQDVEVLRGLVEANVESRDTLFGENYVKELYDKYLRLNVRWAFIGHLVSSQINTLLRVKTLALCVIDSEKIATKLNTALSSNPLDTMPLPVMIQVNVTPDNNKQHGCDPSSVGSLITFIRAECHCLSLVGLMTLGDVSDADHGYSKMNQIRDSLPLKLSMGMSDDWQLALAHGSDQLRLGSVVFGARSPKKAGVK